jgi:hypothetical protein
MPLPKIRVRSKTTGLETVVAESALKHFPDYEPVGDAPEGAPAAPALPPPAAVESPNTTRRAAATNEKE